MVTAVFRYSPNDCPDEGLLKSDVKWVSQIIMNNFFTPTKLSGHKATLPATNTAGDCFYSEYLLNKLLSTTDYWTVSKIETDSCCESFALSACSSSPHCAISLLHHARTHQTEEKKKPILYHDK